ncbi:MAG: hypothetical protein A2W19_03505 [Spirochaetes bacterium RBG_16_49_21]|nr:MAG: hypothetical protein A2W19_03505 [Spirochaetes bacterium RBG_16_49_21]
MKKNIILFFCALIFSLIGCLASLKNFPKEPCVTLPSDKLVATIHSDCIRCHTNDYTTKEDICVRKSLIINAVAAGRMPKMGTLPKEDKDIIVNWK